VAKIVVTHGVPDRYKALLKGHEVIAPEALKVFTKAELIEKTADAEAILACGPLDAEVINSAKKLMIIANYGAGYDRIDVKAADEKGVYVTNTPDETAYPTAELAIGLLLASMRRICELNSLTRQKPSHELFGMGKYMGMGLFGNTLGIIGMGHIGAVVAQFGKLMGMRVLYCNRNRAIEEHGAEYTDLDTLMKESDAVSIHCPLTPETKGLISKEKLSLMKKRSVLINTARGAVVDYDALYEKLKEGELFAAGLDVFYSEPEIPKAFIELDNVVLTPHVGTNTLEARNAMGCAAAARILEALDGKVPRHVVNTPK